jgi:O-antigen/teichoic acid export membrane protein
MPDPSVAVSPRGAYRSPGRSIRVAGGITILNFLVYGLGVVTGPLQARALGPAGRGELAAIVVVPAVLAVIADLGLSTYTLREVAGGRPVREVIGSVLPMSAGLGLVMAVLGVFIATFVAAGRSQVFLFVLLGCCLMPITLSLMILNGINWAQEGWGIWTLVRMVPAVGGFLVTVTLFVGGWLNVSTAAVAIVSLGLLANLPLLSLLRGTGRPRWDVGVARKAISFGARSWLFSVSALANARLDQLMMTRLVPSSELGLYAVAVNVTVLQTAVRSAVISAIFPRVSGGEPALVGRALRTTLALTALIALGLMGVIGVILPWLFGNNFTGAVAMARLLVVAAVPQAGAEILASGLIGGGAPGSAARGQLLALAITIPGLLFLLHPLGGVGAALVSLLAYSVTFGFLLAVTIRRSGGKWSEYVLPRRTDMTALLGALASWLPFGLSGGRTRDVIRRV